MHRNEKTDGTNFTEPKIKEKGMRIAQKIMPILDPLSLDEIIATLVFLNQYYWNRHNKEQEEDKDWKPLEL